MIDYLIVGKGFAGSMLAHQLLKLNKSILVFDHGFSEAASAISSGIINPITGRNLVKSWRVEDFLPVAHQYYQTLEKDFNSTVYRHLPMYRVIKSAKDLNDYSVKCQITEYELILGEEKNLDANTYHPTHVFEVKNTGQVKIPLICELIARELESKNAFIPEVFNHQDLVIQDDCIIYKNIVAKNIIFCEGPTGRFNPLFPAIPFIIAKGEFLLVEIKNLSQKFILNSHKILCPWENDLYWFGATFDWNLEDDITTQGGLKALTDELNQLIKIPYTIHKHAGALRPTIKDRRPVLGSNPSHSNVFLFNGLGTKAASLGPYFIQHFLDHLLHKTPLEKEISYSRFL